MTEVIARGGVFPRRGKMIHFRSLAPLAAIALAAWSAAAAGVTFSVTSLPRNVRQDGFTEVAGELAVMAFSNGTVPAGSTIDITYSAPVTSNSAASSGNISLANNVFCNSAACPSGVELIGSQIIRLSFASDRAFSVTNRMDVVRLRVNASAAGAATVTATVTAMSADPLNNPIDFFSTNQRPVGSVGPSVVITPNPGGNPAKHIPSCEITPGTGFTVRLAGPLTSLLEETMLSPIPAPTNGANVRLTLTGIPIGLTITTPTTTVGNLMPTDGGTFDSAGEPIVLNYTVATSSGGSASATLPFTLTVTGGGTVLPPLTVPANIAATAQVGPVSALDTVIVRMAANSYGPAAVATVADCKPKAGGRLVSD